MMICIWTYDESQNMRYIYSLNIFQMEIERNQYLPVSI